MRWAAWLVVTVGAVLAGARPEGLAAQTPPLSSGSALPPWRVVQEHLVLRPVAGRPGQVEVLDLLRLAPQHASVWQRPLVVLPLPSGYQNLRVLAGIQPRSVALGRDEMRALVQPGPQDAVTVAFRYEVALARLPHAWAVWRPYPVEAAMALVHPEAPVAVLGAQAAGEMVVEGVRYRAFVAAGEADWGLMVLAPVGARPQGAPARPGLSVAAVAGAGLMALAVAAAAAVARRRSGDGSRARHSRDRLLRAFEELEGEFEAGFLESQTYQSARARLAAQLEDGRLAAAGPEAAGRG